MRSKHGWLIAVAIVALMVAACGPQEGGETLSDQATAEQSEVAASDMPPTQAAVVEATEETSESPAASAEMPVDAEDWHALGSPDAPVTIIEYSDFQ
jgi:protein-disulfide isomerase